MERNENSWERGLSCQGPCVRVVKEIDIERKSIFTHFGKLNGETYSILIHFLGNGRKIKGFLGCLGLPLLPPNKSALICLFHLFCSQWMFSAAWSFRGNSVWGLLRAFPTGNQVSTFPCKLALGLALPMERHAPPDPSSPWFRPEAQGLASQQNTGHTCSASVSPLPVSVLLTLV